MSRGRKQAGFTIIETMLFLGITGLIMSFMLIGVGTQLNQRRYQDASTSLLSYVQNQYNLVSNINSSRTGSEVCINHQIKTTSNPSEKDNGRGTSDDCAIIGRLLRSANTGAAIQSTSVVATVDAATLPLHQGDSDAQILHDAQLTMALDTDEYATQWGTKLIAPSPDSDQPSTFSILIVRMPTSGFIHTYASKSDTIALDALVSSSNLVDMKLCLDANGLLGLGAKATGTLIKADAANTSSVEFISQGGC